MRHPPIHGTVAVLGWRAAAARGSWHGVGIPPRSPPHAGARPPAGLPCRRLTGPRTSPRGRNFMAAYIIADIEITDPAGYEEYRRRVPATVAQYGGRYVVRGGPVE